MNTPENKPEFPCFCCDSIGSTFEDVKLEERTNVDGSKYWYAEQAIGTLFGSEVEGACTGIGRTKEQALERLAEDKRRLNGSLWA